MTTLVDELFGQVSREIKEEAPGPEAFTLLLRRVMTHFYRVDTGESYTRLHNFGVCTGTPFAILVGSFASSDGSYGERAHSGTWGRRGVGGGPDGGERAVSHVDAYIVPWFDGYGPEAVRFFG